MARNYQYDREMLANNVRNIENQRNIDIATAAANGAVNTVYTTGMGAMSGNLVAAGAGAATGIAATGINMAATYAKSRADIGYIRETQRINQRNAKRQISNNYQLSEGVNYLLTSIKLGGGKIRIDTPANMTTADFNNFVRLS